MAQTTTAPTTHERLGISPDALKELLTVDAERLREGLPQVRERLARFSARLRGPARDPIEALEERLGVG